VTQVKQTEAPKIQEVAVPVKKEEVKKPAVSKNEVTKSN
jgi:hypothetical protein